MGLSDMARFTSNRQSKNNRCYQATVVIIFALGLLMTSNFTITASEIPEQPIDRSVAGVSNELRSLLPGSINTARTCIQNRWNGQIAGVSNELKVPTLFDVAIV